MAVTVYKIQHTKSGEYSCGGSPPKFTKFGGKTWGTLGRLRSHLTMVMQDPRVFMDDWEVIELEMVESRRMKPHEAASQKKLIKMLTK